MIRFFTNLFGITSPFSYTDAPDHMTEEREARIRHIKGTVALTLIMGVIGFFATPLVVFILVSGANPSPQTVSMIVDYARMTFSRDVWVPHHHMMINKDFIPIQMGWIPGTEDPFLKGITAYAFIVSIFMIIGSLRHLTNRHKKFVMKADARWCTEEDLKKMEARKQVGIKGGFLMSLGLWQTGLRKNQPVRMIETLSALLLAPPGTGKCLGTDVPVLMADGSTKLNGFLKRGDQLMGPDGRPRTILTTNPGRGEMFRIIAEDGSSWTCNGEHILSLVPTAIDRRTMPGDRAREMTVTEYLALSTDERQQWRLWKSLINDHPAPEAAEAAYRHGLALMEAEAKRATQAAAAMADGTSDNVPPKATLIATLDPGEGLVMPRTAEARLAMLAAFVDDSEIIHWSHYCCEIALRSIHADSLARLARSCGLTIDIDDLGHDLSRIMITGPTTLIPSTRRPAGLGHTVIPAISTLAFSVEPAGVANWHGIVLDGDGLYILGDYTVTHNTAGFVIPSLLTSVGVSHCINDQKPEIYTMVGADLEKTSFVFMLDWSKIDKPSTDVFYPRFNFLSKRLMPPSGPDRDTYIDAIAKTLIPEKQGGGDSYFVDKGRGALTGFIHHLVAKVNDAENYDGIPEEWVGKEASIPMLVNWIAAAQMASSGGNKGNTEAQDLYAEAALFGQDPSEYGDAFAPPEPQDTGDKDPMSAWLKSLADEANPHNRAPEDRVGTSNRAFLELSTLVPMADKERSGVLGTMDQALIPFKNQAVMERTSATDFVPADLRGIKDPVTGVWIPMNLFICVNQAEAEAFASITTLLFETLTKYLISFGANEHDPKQNRTMGPFPVCMMMDEFAKLPKCEAVITIPDLGRSKQLSVKLVCQDYGQLEMKYNKQYIDVINTTTAVKIILPQNNKSTVDQIQGMVGKTTIRRASNSYQDGFTKQAFSFNRSDTVEETDFIRAVDVASFPPGEHIVLVQNFMQRPMKLKTQFFFEDPELRDRVYSRGKGEKPKTTIPAFIKDRRLTELKQRIHDKKLKRSELQTFVKETEVDEADAI
ncbi:MAG: type IV secretory system conjugative DNA transfer family protein [Phreatobacter sp.]|nr:type IV secretory system conjugative DNA transfer family protein [Phreatobacter sp.]